MPFPTADTLFKPLPGLVAKKIGPEYIIVPLRDHVADMDCLFTLNETGAFIWEQINGTRNVQDIAEAVHLEFEIDLPTALHDVQEVLAEMEGKIIIR